MSDKLMKNVTKFLGGKKSRPVLQNIHFSKDGNIYATDSKIAIMLEEYNETKSDFILNPKTLKQSTMIYPDLSKLFSLNREHTLILDPILLSQLLTSLKSFKNEQAKLVFSYNKLSITINQSEFYFILPYKDTEEFTIYFEINYLIIALSTFVDEVKVVTLLLNTPTRPIILHSDKIKILVCPIRINKQD